VLAVGVEAQVLIGEEGAVGGWEREWMSVSRGQSSTNIDLQSEDDWRTCEWFSHRRAHHDEEVVSPRQISFGGSPLRRVSFDTMQRGGLALA
jgi:hypothetical protein